MLALIATLSDSFLDYPLRAKCLKCGHERHTEPHALAKFLGWETPNHRAGRLRCSKCNVRWEYELTTSNQLKPRGAGVEANLAALTPPAPFFYGCFS